MHVATFRVQFRYVAISRCADYDADISVSFFRRICACADRQLVLAAKRNGTSSSDTSNDSCWLSSKIEAHPPFLQGYYIPHIRDIIDHTSGKIEKNVLFTRHADWEARRLKTRQQEARLPAEGPNGENICRIYTQYTRSIRFYGGWIVWCGF
jgi:hypothetical protein